MLMIMWKCNCYHSNLDGIYRLGILILSLDLTTDCSSFYFFAGIMWECVEMEPMTVVL